ncbi:ion transport protein domain-containing protein [Ditylenchus destructor]|uniref:Ion transport protein domain-containing protein n=1 Tax=Ditylenchus destructor TaxID=166010 RepID=A0AAD4MQD6_9BILA|nr:ion transport protein domain-containing protein [Ditylenchus destructor]
MNRIWPRDYFTFENVLDAMISLLVVATFEGWTDLIYVAINANEGDNARQGDKGPYNTVATFFICFFVVFAFFMMSIFVGFVVDTFQNKALQREYENCGLDKTQVGGFAIF